MRNDVLIKICENLAKQANEYAEKKDLLSAKVYSGIVLDFLKLANATPEDYRRVTAMLPDIDAEAERAKNIGGETLFIF